MELQETSILKIYRFQVESVKATTLKMNPSWTSLLSISLLPTNLLSISLLPTNLFWINLETKWEVSWVRSRWRLLFVESITIRYINSEVWSITRKEGGSYGKYQINHLTLSVNWEAFLDKNQKVCLENNLSLIHIWRCRRSTLCRSRWSPYH